MRAPVPLAPGALAAGACLPPLHRGVRDRGSHRGKGVPRVTSRSAVRCAAVG